MPDKVIFTDSGEYDADTFGGRGGIIQPTTDVEEEEKMERKEDTGGCGGGDEGRSVGEDLSKASSPRGLSFLFCKWGRCALLLVGL